MIQKNLSDVFFQVCFLFRIIPLMNSPQQSLKLSCHSHIMIAHKKEKNVMNRYKNFKVCFTKNFSK